MSYKYKEKIEEQLNADPIQLALDNEWEKAFEELDEVYAKAVVLDQLQEKLTDLIRFLEMIIDEDDDFIKGQLNILRRIKALNNEGDYS